MLELDERQHLLHERPAGGLAFGEARAVHGHREGVVGRRDQSRDVLLDLADASGGKLDLTLLSRARSRAEAGQAPATGEIEVLA